MRNRKRADADSTGSAQIRANRIANEQSGQAGKLLPLRRRMSRNGCGWTIRYIPLLGTSSPAVNLQPVRDYISRIGADSLQRLICFAHLLTYERETACVEEREALRNRACKGESRVPLLRASRHNSRANARSKPLNRQGRASAIHGFSPYQQAQDFALPTDLESNQ